MRKSIGETQVNIMVHLAYAVLLMRIFYKAYICVYIELPCFGMDYQELKRFPTLQAEIAAASNEALERFREESKKTVVRLVDMESSYLTVDFFRRLPQEIEKAGGPAAAAAAASTGDRYSEGHFRRIGSNVSSYVGMVSDTLRNTIPKAVVYCQVKEAKQSLLNHFYTLLGKKEVCFFILSFQIKKFPFSCQFY